METSEPAVSRTYITGSGRFFRAFALACTRRLGVLLSAPTTFLITNGRLRSIMTHTSFGRNVISLIVSRD